MSSSIKKPASKSGGHRRGWCTLEDAESEISSWLVHAFSQTKPDCRRQCYAVIGASGVGKTRLAQALESRIVKESFPVVVLRRDWFIRGKNTNRRWFDGTSARKLVDSLSWWSEGRDVKEIELWIQDKSRPHTIRLPDHPEHAGITAGRRYSVNRQSG
jgi:hypothetical protein